MRAYLDLVSHVLSNGTRQANRTGVDAISVPGAMLRFDLRDGFPILTTKKVPFNAVKGELIGFLRGCDSAAEFRELGCNVWNANANDPGLPGSPNAWLASPHRKGEDDLGRIYGVQWTGWRDTRTVRSEAEMRALEGAGYELVAEDASRGVWVLERTINQVESVLRKLLTNPTDRRMIVSAWRPDEFDQMALPPCHVMYQFIADVERKELHLCMYQRSVDSGLGFPFNAASSSLFLAIMAKLSGFTAATFTHFMADTHVYVNHVDALTEQLARAPMKRPALVLGEAIAPVTLDTISGVFSRIQPDDIRLEGYESHGPIKMAMAT